MTDHADRPEPDEFRAAFSAALVELIEGDVEAARMRLSNARGEQSGAGSSWPAAEPDGALRSATHRLRARIGQRRTARITASTRAGVFDRDGSRCRFCGREVVDRDRLDIMRTLVGDDALPVDGTVWTSVAGTVDQVRVGRGSGVGSDNLVVACVRCQAERGGRSLSSMGIADPRRSAPGPPAEWSSVASAMARPAPHGRAVLHHVVLLDGCTLNLGGRLVETADPGSLRLRARIGAEVIDRPVELLGSAHVFQAYLPLDAMLAAAPSREPVEIALTSPSGALVDLVCVPGCTNTANHAVIDPIPVVPGADRRLVLDLRRGVAVTVEPLRVEVEVVSVRRDGTELRLGLDVSPGDGGVVTAARLQRRDAPDAASVHLDRDAISGEWVLRPVPSLLDDDLSPTGSIWDIWATWDVAGERHERRAGRPRSDLRLLRHAAVMPKVRERDGEVELVLTPYFTDSRHLAVKVRTVATPESTS